MLDELRLRFWQRVAGAQIPQTSLQHTFSSSISGVDTGSAAEQQGIYSMRSAAAMRYAVLTPAQQQGIDSSSVRVIE